MILLTGATGYIGGRLLRRLDEQGTAVRCLCRTPPVLAGRFSDRVEIAAGDLLDAASLAPALAGIDTAYYLVHSMNSGADFERLERNAATNFATAARQAGVRRIIYVGGLAGGATLSPHMRSRVGTGDILRASGVPVIELRASIVIGSGSASFELIRALVERLPVMITPRWVHTAAQPIAIEDLIEYLLEALELPSGESMTIEIGGRDVTSYVGIMREYARQSGLRRLFFSTPLLSPGLSSRWLTLITPVYASIGRCLIESVRHPSVVTDAEPAKRFRVRPMGIARAIERALANEDHARAETRWSDAGANFGGGPSSTALRNEQSMHVACPAPQAFAPIRRIGGTTGWYYGNVLWRIRGFIDQMMGGVGMRRGRPDAETPFAGTTLDFWRVERYEPDRRIRLFAEMRVPGRAWLEFRAEPQGAMDTVLRQTAYFEPHGLLGLLYWYALWPIHEVMFRGMLRRIAAAAGKLPAPVV